MQKYTTIKVNPQNAFSNIVLLTFKFGKIPKEKGS